MWSLSVGALSAIVLLHGCFAALQLTTNPSTIGTGLTRTLDVICSFRPDATISSLISLQLSLNQTLLAQLNSNDGQVRSSIPSREATVVGAYDKNGDSYIRIVWTNRPEERAGRYQCKANGVNAVGQLQEATRDNIVTAVTPDVTTIVNEMVNLVQKVETLQKIWGDFTTYLQEKINVSASLRTQFIISDSFRGHRYYLNSRTYFFTPNDAHFRCHMYGGYLAEIDDAEEFEFVRSFLKTKNPRFYEMLLGGSDEAQEGQWVFPYTDRPVKYFNWTIGQPDAGRGANNQCIWRDGNYLMSDCVPLMTYDWSFVCEIPDIYAE
ncbi:C-type lectin contains IgSF and conserved C-type lectin [Biomphalaria glabrata]|nr:C-type lectin contains IgSF and conserved C-type lectin [Biomphalaria glabrata]